MGEDVTVAIVGGGYNEVSKEKIDIYANIQVEVNKITISKFVFIELVDGDGNVLYECNNDKELVLNPSLVFILNNL